MRDHRLLPRHPGRAADDRRRRHLGPQPAQHHPDHRRHLLDEHGAGHPRPGQERARARRTSSGPRALGASHTAHRSCGTCCPQVAPLLVANTVLMVAYAIFAETAIAFLGLGDPSADLARGKLIENAFERGAITRRARGGRSCRRASLVAVVILACTMLGTALEDALNPRLRVSHLSVRALPAARPLVGRGRTRCERRQCSRSRTCTSGSTSTAAASCTPCRASSLSLERRRAARPRRRVGLRQDDAQRSRCMGLLPPNASVVGPRAARRRGHPRGRRGRRCARTAGSTSRWSSRAR